MTRVCRTCHQPFATAESIRVHRRDYLCRPADTLLALGWTLTPRGWTQPGVARSPYSRPKPKS